jgi:hypothetical protein
MGERPAEDDGEDKVVFCTKTCYLKWLAEEKRRIKAAKKGEELAAAKKRKTPWEDDGSLTVLMDWMTTHGNYAAYCGSNSNKGKTKTAYHKQLAELIRQKIPGSERTEKDVENKITSLERQFRVATDWAENTGQGVDDPGDFQAAVLKRCPYYMELDPIMGERPNARPLSTNEGEFEEDGPLLSRLLFSSGRAGRAVDQSAEDPASGETEEDLSTPGDASSDVTPQRVAANPNENDTGNSTSISSGESSKRLSSTSLQGSRKKGKQPANADDFITSFFGEGGESLRNLREREVTAREIEAKARMLEAEAISEKTRKETALLRIDERVKIAREQKKLVEEGVCTKEEVDDILPLPSK